MDEIKKNDLSDLSFLKNITIVEDDENESDDFSAESVQENLKQQQYEKSGVYRKFFNVSLDNYIVKSDEEKTALEMCKKFINDVRESFIKDIPSTNKILLLYGTYGTGKTHLSSSIVRELGGLYRTSSKLILEYENCNNFKATKNKIEMLDYYSSSNVLVIDEIGRGFKPDVEREVLMYIINQRYENDLPTVLVTNMIKEELIKFLGYAIYDRLTECCTSIQFTGISKRGLTRNEKENS